VWGGQDGPKRTVSVVRKATPQALPTLFGRFLKRNCANFAKRSSKKFAVPGSLPLLTRDLIYTTAVASISIKNSGKAKRVTPSSVLAGRQPAADKRVVIVSPASPNLSTSVV
jgi:hypothetical protein